MTTDLTASVRYRAAWVPDDDPERPWDDAVALALRWLDSEASGGPVVLVTHSFDNVSPGNRPLARFTRGRNHITPRSGPASAPRGPVLAYAPSPEALELAMNRARGSALCVVETRSTPVHGWALVTGAVNLLTGAVEVLDGRLRKPLERLKFYGNNGYGNDFDRRGARSALDDIRSAGLLDRDLIVSAVAALGISQRGQDQLGKLIDR
jgi:hypothetical protein